MKSLSLRIGILLVLFLCFSMTACSVSNGQVGQYSDFTLDTIDGGSMTLSDTLQAKNVVLVFWATWCPYCVQEIPAANKYYSAHKDEVTVIGVNIQESAGKVASFANKKGIQYPVVLDTHGDVARSYEVRGIPAIVAINKQGEILYSGHDIVEMEQKVKF